MQGYTAGMKIRPARPSDAEPALALIRRAYAPFIGRLPDLPDVSAGVAGDIGLGWSFVAENGATLTGIALAAPAGDGLHLMNIAVDPDAAGQGVGSTLVRALEDAAQAAGITSLALATHRDMPRNVGFYRKLGWSVTGTDGTRIMMARHLPSSDRSG